MKKIVIIIILLFLLGCNSDSNSKTWVSTGNPEFKCVISENTISLSNYEYIDEISSDNSRDLICYDYEIISKKEINTKFQTTYYFVHPIDDSEIYLITSQIDSAGTMRIYPRATYLGKTKSEALLFWKEMESLYKAFDSIPLRNSLVHLKEKEYNEISKLAVLDTITPEFYIKLLENSLSFVDSNGVLNSYNFGGFRLFEGIYCKVLIQEKYNSYKSIESVYKFEKSYFENSNYHCEAKRDSILNSKPFYNKIRNLQENLYSKTYNSLSKAKHP